MTETTDPPRRRPAPGGDRARVRPSGADRQRGAEPLPASDDARVAKVMARAGLCSRRDAETWIAAGRVAVNGRTIDSPALNVSPRDRIAVDGMALPDREPTRLFLFHKPRGLVTTARDPEGRPTIFENLPEGLPRVVSVGRLDINTEGLMLLTNDGGLARMLELPSTGWLRRYRVRANGAVDQAKLDALKDGVTIDGVDYAGIEAALDRVQGANVWLTMGLREGKNREIKRVLESLGLAVTRLIRVSFGPFQLGELAAGAAESVPTRVLRDQLGPDLAARAGVHFPDGPARTPAAARDEDRRRPHVSALRQARDESKDGPRRRIERAATADRRGRPVKVERVVPAGTGASRDDSGGSRNARRFAKEKRDARFARPDAVDRTERPARPRGGAGLADASRPEGRAKVARQRDSGVPDRRGRPAGATGKPRTVSDTPNGRAGGFGSERPATGRNRPDRFNERGTRQEHEARGPRSAERAMGADRPRSGAPSGRGGRPGGTKPRGDGPTGRRPPRGS